MRSQDFFLKDVLEFTGYIPPRGTKVITGDIVELVGKFPSEIEDKLPPTDPLKKLHLRDTGCFRDAGKANWARLPAPEVVTA